MWRWKILQMPAANKHLTYSVFFFFKFFLFIYFFTETVGEEPLHCYFEIVWCFHNHHLTSTWVTGRTENICAGWHAVSSNQPGFHAVMVIKCLWGGEFLELHMLPFWVKVVLVFFFFLSHVSQMCHMSVGQKVPRDYLPRYFIAWSQHQLIAPVNM